MTLDGDISWFLKSHTLLINVFIFRYADMLKTKWECMDYGNC